MATTESVDKATGSEMAEDKKKPQEPSDINPELIENGFDGLLPKSYQISSFTSRPLSGIIVTMAHRWMISLPVSTEFHELPLNVTFVLDTGCPGVQLCTTAQKALSLYNRPPEDFRLRINNEADEYLWDPIDLNMSEEIDQMGVNLLGWSFWRNKPGSFSFTDTHFHYVPRTVISLHFSNRMIELDGPSHKLYTSINLTPGTAGNYRDILDDVAAKIEEYTIDNEQSTATSAKGAVVKKSLLAKEVTGKLLYHTRELCKRAKCVAKLFQKKPQGQHATINTPSISTDPFHQSPEQPQPKSGAGAEMFCLLNHINPLYPVPFDDVSESEVASGWGGKLQGNLTNAPDEIEQGRLRGILTEAGRHVISLPCKYSWDGRRIIYVNFVVDENARLTYFCEKAVVEFIGRIPSPDWVGARLNGISLGTNCAPTTGTNREFISILGSYFLRKAGLSIVTDWVAREFELVPTSKAPFTDRAHLQKLDHRTRFAEITAVDVESGFGGRIERNLSPAASTEVNSLDGGKLSEVRFYRPIISLPCHGLGQGKAVNVVFVVDRHVNTHLSKDTITRLLGPSDDYGTRPGDSTEPLPPILINGTEMDSCLPSRAPHPFLNILGKDFLEMHRLSLMVDWERATFKMEALVFASESCVVPAKDKLLVPTGLKVALPAGRYARLAPWSELAPKDFIRVGVEVIDEDYHGQIKVPLSNCSEEDFKVNKGDPIAQLIRMKISQPQLDEAKDEVELENPPKGQQMAATKVQEMLRFVRLTSTASPPIYGSAKAAGADLCASESCVVPAKGKLLVPTGLKIALPTGHTGYIVPCSELVSKHFIRVGAVRIGEPYPSMEIKVLLSNSSEEDFKVNKRDRIAQLICEKIFQPQLDETKGEGELEGKLRGNGGFGSTGVVGVATGNGTLSAIELNGKSD